MSKLNSLLYLLFRHFSQYDEQATNSIKYNENSFIKTAISRRFIRVCEPRRFNRRIVRVVILFEKENKCVFKTHFLLSYSFFLFFIRLFIVLPFFIFQSNAIHLTNKKKQQNECHNLHSFFNIQMVENNIHSDCILLLHKQ